ncbi:MAG: hypothetical protein AAGF48_13795 [Pseudomonadota bacterium]
MLRTLFLSCLALVLCTAANAAHHKTVSKSKSFKEFSEQFCAAKRDAQHIFVVPVSVFTEGSVKCDDGESKLRTTEPKDDPGHMVFNVDPPAGSKNSFDCDGKADTNMTTVAINCLPVSKEAASHQKN